MPVKPAVVVRVTTGEQPGKQYRPRGAKKFLECEGPVFYCVAHRPEAVGFAVGLYITAAYWFTASTSFANPAVTLARKSVKQWTILLLRSSQSPFRDGDNRGEIPLSQIVEHRAGR